jgi:hypothetical protein
MKLRLVATCSICGCITLKEQYITTIVGNKARVERCITKTFSLKEITYFSSVHFVDEHNINAPTMRYNVDDLPHLNDLKKF